MTASLASIQLEEALHAARSRNASDVHLSPGCAPVLRIDGALEVLQSGITSKQDLEAIAGALLDEAARARLAATGDASSTYRAHDFGPARVHAYKTTAGIALAIRLLAANVPSLESLHLPAVIAKFTERPHGLVIFSGPTGSGKTTALAALVDRINRTQSRHILTIEDPIEYEHESNRSIVSQREVGRNVGSFAQGIRGALRSDPDVILLGEMRDRSTMHAALTAAETGHLVYATLHTGDAPQSIDRIISNFDGQAQEQIRVQLAQTLAGVVCMRLLPRASGTGRRCAAEVLVANDAVRNLIREGKSHLIRNVISTGRHIGMQTLEAHLCDLIARREITMESALLVTDRVAEVRSAEVHA